MQWIITERGNREDDALTRSEEPVPCQNSQQLL
jgi:hypothetical protein